MLRETPGNFGGFKREDLRHPEGPFLTKPPHPARLCITKRLKHFVTTVIQRTALRGCHSAEEESRRGLPVLGVEAAGDKARSKRSRFCSSSGVNGAPIKGFFFFPFLQKSTRIHETPPFGKLTEPPLDVGSHQPLGPGEGVCVFLGQSSSTHGSYL